jgi:hypothetical protein
MNKLESCIVIFTYNRPEHTLRMLDSLKQCIGIENFKIMLFQDGPKNLFDQESVSNVTAILEDFQKNFDAELFKSVRNYGLSKSVISGTSRAFLDFSSVMAFEDDLVFSPYVLEYLQHSISIMAENPSIFAASAYTPLDFRRTLRSLHPEQAAYLSTRTHSWGWATTRENWQRIDWELSDLNTVLRDTVTLDFFSKGGSDLIPMLLQQVQGNIDSWAIRMALHAAREQKYTIYPASTLVRNLGFDGTGEHCGINDDIQNQILDDDFIPGNFQVTLETWGEVSSLFKNYYNLR